MLRLIAHRGPDGSGVYTDGAFGLGHRRLSIIDLSTAGHQPMATADGRYVLSYNGEVYNFKEIREELIALGYSFQSRTDSEVVLKALVQWGLGAIPRFNGMFALALWDSHTKELTLARDRFGIKPLYCSWSGGDFMFASEIKALLAHPAFQVNVDLEGLTEYMTFQNFLTPRTLFHNVTLLPPGTWMTVKAGKPAEPTRYWDFDFIEPEFARDDDSYLEEFKSLFDAAVRRQLVADCPVGSYLSGGMDSSMITGVAARHIDHLHTFTVGFDLRSASGMEIFFDERAVAEHISYLFNTEQYEFVLKAGDMERIIPKLVWHLEEPRIGQSYPNMYAARLARHYNKVVLSGAGGDELFGGYPWRYYRSVVNDDFEHYIDKYYQFWQRLIPNRHLRAVLSPVWESVEHVWTRDIFKNVFKTHSDQLSRPEDYINHSLYFEARTFLHGLLVVEDKLSMAHGLETRVPFLDNQLVDFAMRLPARQKLGKLDEVIRLNENEPGPKTEKYFQKARDGKLILRRAARDYLPESVTDGSKQGFSAPDASWFRGESIDYVRSKIFNRDAKIYDYLDYNSSKVLIDEHMNGTENRRLLIWSLLYLEQWCESFLYPSQPFLPSPSESEQPAMDAILV